MLVTTCSSSQTHTKTSARAHKHKHARARRHRYKHTHTHIHTHTHAHTHTSTQTVLPSPNSNPFPMPKVNLICCLLPGIVYLSLSNFLFLTIPIFTWTLFLLHPHSLHPKSLPPTSIMFLFPNNPHPPCSYPRTTHIPHVPIPEQPTSPMFL